MFQSTHLHEVWLQKWNVRLTLAKFQSTHLHEVWLFVSVRWYCSCEVSIHTPTWGVTFLREYEAWLRQVSIHTPTWGVTIEGKQYVDTTVFQSTHLHEVWLLIVWTIRLIRCFNPHTYMRCDLRGRRQQGDRHVSIHTPTWGVTGFSVRCQNQNDVSIHTPTWGVTNRVYLLTLTIKFQSTHLHEVWLDMMHKNSIHFKFQSTHLHEVWLAEANKIAGVDTVSIHTPTWGVTLPAIICLINTHVSIHTPTWGVTWQ